MTGFNALMVAMKVKKQSVKIRKLEEYLIPHLDFFIRQGGGSIILGDDAAL